MAGDMGQVFFLSLPWLLLVISSYLMGSIPAGYLAGRLCGVDLRTQGSGNIGATNALRVLGKAWGSGVFLVDFLKGLLPVYLAGIWSAQLGVHPSSAPGALAGLCVLLGHSFPVWLRFQGGKGIASSAGVIVGLFPSVFFFCIGSWLFFFMLTRYVSVASIAASITLPLAVAMLFMLHRADWLALLLSMMMCLLALWRHRSNIARLRVGMEPRFEQKKENKKP